MILHTALAIGVLPAASALAGLESTRVATDTSYVEAMVRADDALWVGTRGGLEAYELDRPSRRRLYTTLDGLPSNRVVAVTVHGGQVVARTESFSCTLAGDRFHCQPAPPWPMAAPAVAALFLGARVTVRLGEFVGTAGAGLWLDGPEPKRLTPAEQICSNHLTAVARYRKQLWFGAFDAGLCTSGDGGRTFRRIATPFRMVNDLAATPYGLYVAAASGLFVTVDGQRFARVEAVTQRGVNGLAFAGGSLYATTPGALWRLRLRGGPRDRVWWRPAGSRSLQGVAVGPSSVWLVSEDRGAIRMTQRGFVAYDRAAGAPTSWALAVAVDQRDTAYVGTLRHGVVAIDRRGRMRSLAGVPDPWVLDVRTFFGRVWVGTQGGAARIAPDGQAALVHALPHPCVHAIVEDRGLVYLATEAGLLITRA
jgi:ligand-binding sensor domain-containing protein